MKMARALGYDDNANARPESSGSGTQRPNSAPASVCEHNVCCKGSCQFSSHGKGPSRNFSGTQALGKRSSGSLAVSKSFETPYGVIRQSSSSTVEPVRMHSGTSQESFRREMSAYKLQTMPVLSEDANSDEDDELGARTKTSNLSKLKKTKAGSCSNNENKSTGCSNFLKIFFSCGKSSENKHVDSGNLLDVTKDDNDHR